MTKSNPVGRFYRPVSRIRVPVNTSTSDDLSLEGLQQRAYELVRQQSVLTLATALDNRGWSAPVYYIYLKGSFYFFSDFRSEHIREALLSGQAAGSIFAASDRWKDIRGLQMSGIIRAVSKKLEAAEVIGVYLKKYPFTRDFFPHKIAVDLSLFKEKFHVSLYRYAPSLIYYSDNRIRFAFREKIPSFPE